MTPEEIEAAAEKYSDKFRPKDQDEIYYAFKAGSLSREKEIEELKKTVERKNAVIEQRMLEAEELQKEVERLKATIEGNGGVIVTIQEKS